MNLSSAYVIFLLLLLLPLHDVSADVCTKTCDALASYYLHDDDGGGASLTSIARLLNTTDVTIQAFNKVKPSQQLKSNTRVNVPFLCNCLNGSFNGHVFLYDVAKGDTYERVARGIYANLTTYEAMVWFNREVSEFDIPDSNARLNVVVNCTCGDAAVGSHAMFVTYALREGESLSSIAKTEGVEESLLRGYNPGVDFSRGSGYVYFPGKDQNGNYVILKASSAGLAGGAIAGAAVGVIAVVLLATGGVYFGVYGKNKVDTTAVLPTSEVRSSQNGQSLETILYKSPEYDSSSRGPTGMTMENSVEFPLEELSKATNNFSLANKIGQGGFGAVYYAELRGEKAAIKKMEMKASKEFLAELTVLTHVHHLNLVRLIGYCVEGSLFLVYEYIENGNLSQHLRDSEKDPIPWSNRLQIALDSARGLEYIHEHTVPVYIHRDIKSANILIDKNYNAKVADFGLTKLAEVGSSLSTRVAGTFGYMPPEYAQWGEVSPKVDVFAFGVVLYELISAKEAVVRPNASVAESRSLVSLFEEVLDHPDPREDLQKVIDPRLGDDYPFESVCKMAQLARGCVHENKDLRPSMRSIVVELTTLSSLTEDWDVNQVLGI